MGRVHRGTGFLNAVIGTAWGILGFLLFAVSLLWLLSPLLARLFGTPILGVAAPSDTRDFLLIAAGLFMGLFLLGWSQAMVRRREWGALAGGLLRMTILAYLLVMIVLLYQSSERWLSGRLLDAYNRYGWLIWVGLGLLVVWLLLTTYFLLVGQNRREYYARAHMQSPAPELDVCPRCGLILEGGLCPVHDQRTRNAYLHIGDRKVHLPFTEDHAAFIIGRQKDVNEAYITLSSRDTAQPERISGQHCMIRYHFEAEQFTIEDMHSLNKTYLGDSPDPLSPSEPWPLRDGDRINLAKEIDLIFEASPKGNQL